MSALQRQTACSLRIDLVNKKFLVDTGADLGMYPHRFNPRHKEWVNYDLCASNGTIIHTYRWLPLSLNLGLCRDFTWRFVVAKVTHPIIGVDFLSHFGLLVDCQKTDYWTESHHCLYQPMPPIR
jgi:hypothetical protein